MINPDCELLDDGLDRFAANADSLRALVGPRMLNPDGTIQASASGPEVGIWPWIRAVVPGAIAPPAILRFTEPYRLEARVRVAWLTGSCVAGRREDLLTLGPFDEALQMYGEDVDLGLRAEAAGIASYFCPESARCRPPRGRFLEPRLWISRRLADQRGAQLAIGPEAPLRTGRRTTRLVGAAVEHGCETRSEASPGKGE